MSRYVRVKPSFIRCVRCEQPIVKKGRTKYCRACRGALINQYSREYHRKARRALRELKEQSSGEVARHLQLELESLKLYALDRGCPPFEGNICDAVKSWVSMILHRSQALESDRDTWRKVAMGSVGCQEAQTVLPSLQGEE